MDNSGVNVNLGGDVSLSFCGSHAWLTYLAPAPAVYFSLYKCQQNPPKLSGSIYLGRYIIRLEY